ncbi:hypothetical protein KCU60_g58, partial [Aureobasidium melanogenum]
MHFERFLSQKTPIFTLLSKHACVCDFLPIEALNNEKCQIKAQPVRLRGYLSLNVKPVPVECIAHRHTKPQPASRIS